MNRFICVIALLCASVAFCVSAVAQNSPRPAPKPPSERVITIPPASLSSERVPAGTEEDPYKVGNRTANVAIGTKPKMYVQCQLPNNEWSQVKLLEPKLGRSFVLLGCRDDGGLIFMETNYVAYATPQRSGDVTQHVISVSRIP